jgi:hypothetical protein
MKKWLLFFLLIGVTPAMAADVSFQAGMTQQMFQDFSKYTASVLVYRAVSPAAPLGVTGFDIGVEVTATSLDSGKDYWKKAFQSQDAPSYIFAPKLHLQKGLPFDIDVGLVYSKVPDTNIQYIGGEVKYAIYKGLSDSNSLILRPMAWNWRPVRVSAQELKLLPTHRSVNIGSSAHPRAFLPESRWTMKVSR